MKILFLSPAKLHPGPRVIAFGLHLAGLFCCGAITLHAADGNFNNVTVAGNFTLGNATASGNNSLAAGNGAMASGNYSIALGTNVTANTWSSVTVGHYNAAITGNPSAWAAADPAFIVGIGNSTAAANGLVLLNSGLVGIGTNTPGEELEVAGIGRLKLSRPDNGSSRVYTGNDIGSLKIYAATALNGGPTIEMYGNISGGVADAGISGNGSIKIATSNNGTAYFTQEPPALFAGYPLLVIAGTGNIGVGTATPAAKFNVAGDSLLSGNLAVSGLITGNVTYARRQGDIIMGTYGNGGGD
jgi:hypothetical protein